jgi:hypothetical protein
MRLTRMVTMKVRSMRGNMTGSGSSSNSPMLTSAVRPRTSVWKAMGGWVAWRTFWILLKWA